MWCAIYWLCLLAVGYGVAAPLLNSRSLLERFGVAACLGPGVLGLLLIAISMLGLRPRAPVIFLIAGIFALIAIFYRSPDAEKLQKSLPAPRWLLFVCFLAIAYGIFIVATDALIYPAVEWDAFAIWQLKGKILAQLALHPTPSYFSDVSLSYSHLRYPILVPMISAGIHALTGQLNDELGKTPFLLMYLGLGAAIFSAVNRRRGQSAALIATALILTTPVMLAYAGAGTADLALTAFYACSILCILRWQENQGTGDLLLAFIFTVCMAWTKNEGLPIGAINCFVLIVLTPKPLATRHLMKSVGFTILFVVLYLPWFRYIHYLPRTDENYSQRLNPSEIISHIDRIPAILGGMAANAVDLQTWGIFWFVLIAVTIFQWKRILSRPILTLWILLLLQLVPYLAAYMVVSNWNLDELLSVSAGRLLMHLTPAAALLIGWQWPGLFPSPRTQGEGVGV